MHAAKSKQKTSPSSVSKSKSTNAASALKTSSEEASSSKSLPLQNVTPNEQLHNSPAVEDSAITSSTATRTSDFYCFCRNNEIEAVIALLPTLTLDEVNQTEPNGSTALHAAAYHGNQEIVKLLLAKGAQRTIKNLYGCTPYDEAKTDNIKKLFEQGNETRAESEIRFVGEKGPSFEWIFVKSDPSRYASFNRTSLLECGSDEDFQRLCRGIQQHYINEKGPLADVEGIKEIRLFFDEAIKENDPTQIVRAYTAPTEFYTRLNKDMSQLPTHWSGRKHERNIASIMMFHPVFQTLSFTGETYRGMIMSLDDLKEYVVDSVFMNKTFLSTSKERTQAEHFTASHVSSTVFQVICKYSIKYTGTALAIETISKFPDEKEVLILPYAAFKVKSIKNSIKNASGITEITVEEENSVEWPIKKPYQTSHMNTSVEKQTAENQDGNDDRFSQMFKDSQEKGEIDSDDIARWKQTSFGINPSINIYTELRSNVKQSNLSADDLTKWKKDYGLGTKDDDHEHPNIESRDTEAHSKIFTAFNKQSYATLKKSDSKQLSDMEESKTNFDSDSDY
ncbi:unnamed protein product [Adineta steineri]|uniref:ADP ribosyltransferase domain-containing protein n=1 Tax=Adineta steineri TaxID=433720 RepID=A0A813URX5_9BILA|nr:unnamed protein product [Adineta steineri]CAF3678475.1 unnamed protein product [Adineta steineri]